MQVGAKLGLLYNYVEDISIAGRSTIGKTKTFYHLRSRRFFSLLNQTTEYIKLIYMDRELSLSSANNVRLLI